MTYILRRRMLGRKSCNSIAKFSEKDIKVVLNDVDVIPKDDLCIRWGCTANLPNKPKVINTAAGIHAVSDKAGFRELLVEKDLAPRDALGEQIILPCIVRPQHHHQGRHLYVANTDKELAGAIVKCGPGFYASEVIDKVAEYRVFVAQDRVLCVAQKFHPDPKAIAWNVAQGGKFVNVRWDEWPIEVCKMGIKAHKLSGLDFSGVDIIVDKHRPYVLESNSAPSLTSEYRQRCFAKAFDYIIENGKEPIPANRKGGWRGVIHPAIWPRKGE